VAVQEDGRDVARSVRGANLSDNERRALRLEDLRIAAYALDEISKPLARAPDVVSMCRVRADARDAKPFEELLEPRGIDCLRSGHSG
jgi:hypothetical protein